MTNKEIAKQILENVGGASNVTFLTHCVTRLRFSLKNEGKANTDKLEALEGRLFIPAHAEPTDNIRPLVAKNRAKVLEVLDGIQAMCQTPLTTEQVIQAVFNRYDLKMVHNQYATVGATIRSCLSYLHDQKELEITFTDNLMYWSR